jgi:hypothetical protein
MNKVDQFIVDWADEIDPDGDALFFEQLDAKGHTAYANVVFFVGPFVFLVAVEPHRLSGVVIFDDDRVAVDLPHGPMSRKTWEAMKTAMLAYATAAPDNWARSTVQNMRDGSARNFPHAEWSDVLTRASIR